MELEKIEQIFETSDEEEVNKYLNADWVLLATSPGVSRTEVGDRPFILYSLGHPFNG